MSRFARKVDLNHAEIRDGLRELGFTVQDLAAYGRGVADLIVYDNATERWAWVEVKSPGGKLTPAEVAFRREWAPHFVIAMTVEDVLNYFRGEVS